MMMGGFINKENPEVKQNWVMPEDQLYLLNHAVGLLPASSRTALEMLFFKPWLDAEKAWPQWLDSLECFKKSLSQLLGGEAGDFCPQSNVSSGLTKLLHSFELTKNRRSILLSEDDFPTIGFVATQCPHLQVKYIPSGAPLEDAQFWSDFLSDDIGIVMITHAQSSTGRLVPVKEITELAKERGIFNVVDIAQSAGVVPIDITQWRADAVIGSCVKWLCGGPGAGFLWVSPNQVQTLKPVDVGWFSHRDPFEFDIHSFDFAADASRFLGGTPSVAAYVLAHNGIQELFDIGIDVIRQHNCIARSHLASWFSPEDIVSPKNQQFQNGSLIVASSEHNKALLQARRVAFDERPNGLRLSPHIYNSLETLNQ